MQVRKTEIQTGRTRQGAGCYLICFFCQANVRVSNTQTSENTSFADEPPITHMLLPKTAAVWYARPSKGNGSKPVSQRCRRESKRRRPGKNVSLLDPGGQDELLLALGSLSHLLQLHIHAHSPVPATDYIDVTL